MSVTPLDATRPPEASDLLDQMGRGMIPAPGRIVAAVEAYPGPTPDWRSLLVTETLKGALPALGIRRGESAVIAARHSASREMARYQRAGWRPYRMDDLLKGVIGDLDYRRSLGKAAPRQRQVQVKKMLHDLSAPSSALWPVMRTLDAFYRSDDDMPGHQHLTGWTRNEDDVVRWAGILWGKQRDDPIGSGLGLPREAMPKYWQHRHGGVWPDLPPDLPPKLIVVAQAEELTPSELRLLANQPCPVLCFGDPAIGVQGAIPEELNTYPLGSRVLGDLHATTLGCESGLERAIRHVIRNDVEIPDAWVQTVGALSAVSLDRERPGFAAYRHLTHTPSSMPHHPPLSSPDARPGAIISRTGIAALRHVLDALRPIKRVPVEERPKLKIHMDAQFSQLVKEAHEVAQLFYLPEDRWERQVSQRYRKGRDAALEMCAKSPSKAAMLDLFRQRDDPALAGVLKLLGNIEYRGTRIIHASGLKDADQADGQETTLHIGDPPDLRQLKGEPVTIVEAELASAGTGQAQASCLYRVLAQRPVEISPSSEETIEFLERAHDWLAVKRSPDASMSGGTPAPEPPPSEAPAPAEDASPAEPVSPPSKAPAPEEDSPPAETAPSEDEPLETHAAAAGATPSQEDGAADEPAPQESDTLTSSTPADPAEQPEAATPTEANPQLAPGSTAHEPPGPRRAAEPQDMPRAENVPPALSDWAHDVFEDARMHEASMEGDDLDSLLWEYHQNTPWEALDHPSPDAPSTPTNTTPQGSSDTPDTTAQGDSGMNRDIPDEGTRRQSELRDAWGTAAEGILKRKGDQASPAPSMPRHSTPGG